MHCSMTLARYKKKMLRKYIVLDICSSKKAKKKITTECENRRYRMMTITLTFSNQSIDFIFFRLSQPFSSNKLNQNFGLDDL